MIGEKDVEKGKEKREGKSGGKGEKQSPEPP